MINWLSLENQDQLDHIVEKSTQGPVLIFKHSTRCFISKMALRNFENEFNSDTVPCYFLDLITYRDLSNLIAERFNIQHQSPQLLVLQNKVVTLSQTHENIDAQSILTYVKDSYKGI